MALEVPIRAERSAFSDNREAFSDDALRLLVDRRLVYPHQAEAARAIRQALNFGNRPLTEMGEQNITLAVLPTGTGKSGIAVLSSYLLGASRVLFVTPSETITQQLFSDFCGGMIDGEYVPSWLVQRGIFRVGNENAVVPTGIQILRTEQLRDQRNLRVSLVVSNAHKFGANDGDRGVPIGQIPANEFPLVIVDEAHHYPAVTWTRIIEHFQQSKIIFLTATPFHGRNRQHILEGRECFNLPLQRAIEDGIIRPREFEEENSLDEMIQRINQRLNEHDHDNPLHLPRRHQAMVLCQTIDTLNSSDEFVGRYDVLYPGQCRAYHSRSGNTKVDFQNYNVRVLVVIGRLLEGFDQKTVSVLGIYRNVSPNSRVLFSQFVGRGVRKICPNDPITTRVISQVRLNQRGNFNAMDDQIADEDPVDNF